MQEMVEYNVGLANYFLVCLAVLLEYMNLVNCRQGATNI